MFRLLGFWIFFHGPADRATDLQPAGGVPDQRAGFGVLGLRLRGDGSTCLGPWLHDGPNHLLHQGPGGRELRAQGLGCKGLGFKG